MNNDISSSTLCIAGRRLLMEEFSRRYRLRDDSSAYDNLACPRYPTPPPDYDADSLTEDCSLGESSHYGLATIPEEDYYSAGASGCPSSYYDSSEESNSDVTLLIEDEDDIDSIDGISVDIDNRQAVILNLAKQSCAFKNMGYSGISDRYGLSGSATVSRSPDPQLILCPPRLTELLSHLENSSMDSNRLYLSMNNDYNELMRRYGCGFEDLFYWMVLFVFVVGMIGFLSQVYPDSPAIWVLLVVLIILIFSGLNKVLPPCYRKFFGRE